MALAYEVIVRVNSDPDEWNRKMSFLKTVTAANCARAADSTVVRPGCLCDAEIMVLAFEDDEYLAGFALASADVGNDEVLLVETVTSRTATVGIHELMEITARAAGYEWILLRVLPHAVRIYESLGYIPMTGKYSQDVLDLSEEYERNVVRHVRDVNGRAGKLALFVRDLIRCGFCEDSRGRSFADTPPVGLSGEEMKKRLSARYAPHPRLSAQSNNVVAIAVSAPPMWAMAAPRSGTATVVVDGAGVQPKPQSASEVYAQAMVQSDSPSSAQAPAPAPAPTPAPTAPSPAPAPTAPSPSPSPPPTQTPAPAAERKSEARAKSSISFDGSVDVEFKGESGSGFVGTGNDPLYRSAARIFDGDEKSNREPPHSPKRAEALFDEDDDDDEVSYDSDDSSGSDGSSSAYTSGEEMRSSSDAGGDSRKSKVGDSGGRPLEKSGRDESYHDSLMSFFRDDARSADDALGSGMGLNVSGTPFA